MKVNSCIEGGEETPEGGHSFPSEAEALKYRTLAGDKG
jgi:hypothetical protein